MEVEDLIALAAHNLWIHVPQSARDRFFIILVRELLRENRRVQEQAGVGLESQLTPYYKNQLNALLEQWEWWE